MDMGLLAPVLTSALVAAAVTLLIELIAKPHLEVRKDRIVRRDRLRDEALRNLSATFNRICELAPKGPTDTYERFRQKAAEVLIKLDWLEDHRDLYEPLFRRGLMGSLTFYIEASRIFVSAADRLYRTLEQQERDQPTNSRNPYSTVKHILEIPNTIFKPKLEYATTSRRHPLRRLRLRRRLHSEPQEYSTEELLIGAREFYQKKAEDERPQNPFPEPSDEVRAELQKFLSSPDEPPHPILLEYARRFTDI